MILYEKFKQKKNDFEKLLFYQIDADNNLENHINLKNRNGGLQITNNKLRLLGKKTSEEMTHGKYQCLNAGSKTKTKFHISYLPNS